MSTADYVREYFSEHATAWLAAAYGEGEYPWKYPVGLHRVRLTIEAITNHLGTTGARLADLGCGGGELCAHAAMIGMRVVGVDAAEGMIAAGRKHIESLPDDARGRVEFVLGDVLATRLEGEFDAVSALGLIEYLPDDDAFLSAAAAYLRPGGVLVVSCRNRLFNLTSMNEYTRSELAAGGADELVAELEGIFAAGLPHTRLAELVSRLEEGLPSLRAALDVDRQGADASGRRPTFGEPRRQHSPRQLAAAAARAGFERPQFVGVHPHPLPPALEDAAPRFYNQLAGVFESLEAEPASLAWSSAFLGVFVRAKT